MNRAERPEPVADVSVLGLGNMGSALARAQLAAGRRVVVWNRTAARTKPLEDLGARAVATVREAFEAAPTVILCAGHHATGLAILEQAADSAESRTVVSLTIGLPEHARTMARVTAAHGARFVEGVIMVFPQAIATESSRILYAADEADFAEARPVLDAFGGAQLRVSDTPGSVSALGIASAGFFHLCFQSFAAMSALAGRYGVDLDVSTRELVAFLEVVGEAAETAGPALSGHVRTSDTSTIALGADEMRDIHEVMKPLGLDTALVAAARSSLERAMAAGYGGGPVGSVIHALDHSTSDGDPASGA